MPPDVGAQLQCEGAHQEGRPDWQPGGRNGSATFIEGQGALELLVAARTTAKTATDRLWPDRDMICRNHELSSFGQ